METIDFKNGDSENMTICRCHTEEDRKRCSRKIKGRKKVCMYYADWCVGEGLFHHCDEHKNDEA